MYRLFASALLVGLLLSAVPAQQPADPLAFLYDGKLVAGAKGLEKHLADKPDDDKARCALGTVQFLRAFEKLGTGLYKYGLITHSRFPGTPRNLADLMPENPNPEKASHAAIRKLVEEFVADLDQAEKTLAQVKADDLHLPVFVARVKVDLFGQGKPVSAGILFGAMGGTREDVADAERVVVTFDRGDVAWLRGYLHFLCAWGELILALDTKDLFEGGAHHVFANPDTPHSFFKDEPRHMVPFLFGRVVWGDLVDAISTVYHALNLPIQEPERVKRAYAHLEGMVAQGKQMWKYILDEKDDENEWIPNPKQVGVLRVPVSAEMIQEWRKVLDEADEVLQGKKLLPFWRGKLDGSVGVNLQKVFTDPPKRLDIVRWVQGPEATPYLEKGPITPLADPQRIGRLDRIFGGPGFFGFALWFN